MIKQAAKSAFAGFMVLYFVFLFLFGLGDYLFPDFIGKAEGESVPDVLCFSLETRAEKEDDSGDAFSKQRLVAFGIIPLKTVGVRSFHPTEVALGGELFGTRLALGGLLVQELGEVEGDAGKAAPAKDAGLRPGDLIRKADGIRLETSADLSKLIGKAAGPVTLDFVRDGKEISTVLTPLKDAKDGLWKAGLWLRDGAAGIGTVTFRDPVTGHFAGLGHAVCDSAGGKPLPLERGSVFGVEVERIVRSENGAPGEIRGKLEKTETGTLSDNTPCGVHGVLFKKAAARGETILPLGAASDLKCGKATLFCTLDETGTKEYEIEIEEILSKDRKTKNFLLLVTDKALLEKTGGIVQGMSGSPIVQNGKLVGAVTHVLVGDSTRGYGIFAENMLPADR